MFNPQFEFWAALLFNEPLSKLPFPATPREGLLSRPIFRPSGQIQGERRRRRLCTGAAKNKTASLPAAALPLVFCYAKTERKKCRGARDKEVPGIDFFRCPARTGRLISQRHPTQRAKMFYAPMGTESRFCFVVFLFGETELVSRPRLTFQAHLQNGFFGVHGWRLRKEKQLNSNWRLWFAVRNSKSNIPLKTSVEELHLIYCDLDKSSNEDI